MSRGRADVRFVRALLAAGSGERDADGSLKVGRVVLGRDDGERLAGLGLFDMAGAICTPRPEARSWLKRQLLEDDGFAGQHRTLARRTDGTRTNLAESPLARLAAASGGERVPFLDRHHVEAGERVRRLVERAQLRTRVTMNYSPAHTSGGRGHNRAAEVTDMAAEARAELARLIRLLPHDCAGVVLDVCGLEKGLQTIETERGWPRRSAKLVLRIGLDQLAQIFGYAPSAVGAETRRPHAWLGDGARPSVFG